MNAAGLADLQGDGGLKPGGDFARVVLQPVARAPLGALGARGVDGRGQANGGDGAQACEVFHATAGLVQGVLLGVGCDMRA